MSAVGTSKSYVSYPQYGWALRRSCGRPHGAEDRAGGAEGHAAGQVEVADVLHTGLEDGVPGGELVVLGKVLLHLLHELADLVHRTGRQVLGESAGPDVRVVHAQAGDQLVDVENEFTITEAVDHDRGGAQLHAAGGDAHQVGGEPVQLHQEHADDRGAVRDLLLDAEELLHGEAVRRLVEERRQVVHARHERGALRPRAVLEVLLDAGVEIADAAAGLGDGLAVDLQDEPEHTVRGRVLGAHVDDDALVVGPGGGLGDLVPVPAGDRVDGAFGGLARRSGGCVRRAHEYDLRWSGAGIWAPLYSTGMPPRG